MFSHCHNFLILSNSALSLLSLTAMLFTWSCQFKNLYQYLHKDILPSLMDLTFFLLSLIFISSGSAVIGDLKITSSWFSRLSEILFELSLLFKCFTSMNSLIRFFPGLYEKCFYRQQSHAFIDIIFFLNPYLHKKKN